MGKENGRDAHEKAPLSRAGPVEVMRVSGSGPGRQAMAFWKLAAALSQFTTFHQVVT
jgi:hypothetical protein